MNKAREMKTVPGDFEQATEIEDKYGEEAPVMLRFAPNWQLRALIFRGTGVLLVLGAAALWLLPGVGGGDTEMVLFKLGISVIFLFAGLALLLQHHTDNRPDAYFDPIRHEVRVMQKNRRGRPQVILRRTYDSLGSASFTNKCVQLFDVDGSLLMRLQIDNAEVRHSLRNQLGGRVRLAG